MNPYLATIVVGLAVAAITGIVSWIVATSRAVGRLEAVPSSQPAAAETATTAKLIEIEKRLREIQTRLDAEKEYRWPQQDRAMADVTEALRDVDRALRAVLDWHSRAGD